MLDQLGYRTVDVLGVSWGGGLAQEFAHQFPDRCRRLVLVSTGTGTIMVPGRLSALLPLAGPQRYLGPGYMASMVAAFFGTGLRAEPNLAPSPSDESVARSGGAVGYYSQLLASAGWTSIFWLHELRQPTLILSGRKDPVVPSVNGRIMARLIPNSRLHVFDGGHLSLLTSAEQHAPLVREFLLPQVERVINS